MTIYDGPDSSAKKLAEFSSADNGKEFSVNASAENANGCLFLEFVSSGRENGWLAEISCVQPCQEVIAKLQSTLPAVNSEGYIDICVNEAVTLSAQGVYKQSDSYYAQSDATSDFTWTFSGGDTLSGRTVEYAFSEPGGYRVKLRIEDVNDCRSVNEVEVLVRVSPSPTFAAIDSPAENSLCPGENIPIIIGTGTDRAIYLDPKTDEQNFPTRTESSDMVAIPARTGDQTRFSNLDVRVSDPNLKVTGGDIERVCVIMEHSYLDYLNLWIECPGGQRLYLLSDLDFSTEGPTNARLGYGEIDGTGPEPAETYCWSPKADSTVNAVGRALNSVPNDPAILPFDRDYLPHDLSFDALSGCDVNGAWTLNVQDSRNNDDGTIYGWSITFSEDVVPREPDFTVALTDQRWVNNTYLSSYSKARAIFSADNPGYYQQKLEVTDAFGCTYDTLVRIDVASPFDPACYSCPAGDTILALDTTVCGTSSFQIDGLESSALTSPVTWTAFEQTTFTEDYTSTLTVADHLPLKLTNPTRLLTRICVDYKATGDLSQTEISLIAPDGRPLRLAGRGTLSGKTYTVCLTPMDLAEWSTLAGVNINGDWKLVIDDGSGAGGTLTEWSLELLYEPELTYAWSPVSGDFSCTDCPDPTVTPTTDGTYYLTASTSTGCTETYAVRIRVSEGEIGFTETGSGGCVGEDNGFIKLQPDPGNPAVTYAWSTGAKTRDIQGLSPGTYTLTVTTEGGCNEVFTYTLPEPSELDFRVDNVRDAGCGPDAGGSISTTVSGGTAPYTYQWNNGVTDKDGDLEDLSAGTYTATVTDAAGCTQITSARIAGPTAITVTPTVKDVSCAGGNDGSIRLELTGGNGAVTVTWTDLPDGTDQNTLAAGTYTYTAQDESGCSTQGTITVSAPESLYVTAETTDAGCEPADGGSIGLQPSGGTEPYSYAWADGSNNQNRRDLSAGIYAVTVTDQAGCTAEYSTEIGGSDFSISFEEELSGGCAGADNGYITLATDASAPPATYIWNTGDTTLSIQGLAPGSYTLTATSADGSCTQETTYELPAATVLEFRTDSITPAGCSGGGAIYTSVAGGTEPYAYAWNNGVSSTGGDAGAVAAGQYSVTVVDALGCSASLDINVPGAGAITATATTTEVSCGGGSDGSISVAASGGSGVLSITWANLPDGPEQSNLVAGTYNYTVTDEGGCFITGSVVISGAESLQLSAATEGPACGKPDGGSITLTVSGGSGDYTYRWSDGNSTRDRTDVAAGDYSVTVTDTRGCSDSLSVTVIDGGQGSSIAFTAELSGGCTGADNGFIRLQPDGNLPPVTYAWNTGDTTRDISGLAPGTFTLTVTEPGGCSQQFTYDLPASTPLEFVVDSVRNAGCGGDISGAIFTSVSGGTAPFSYTWSGGLTGPDGKAEEVSPGDYTVTVTDAAGCTATASASVTGSSSLAVEVSSTDVNCAGSSDGRIELSVTGSRGAPSVSWENLSEGSVQENLPAGVYRYTVTDGGNCPLTGTVEINAPEPLTLTAATTSPGCSDDSGGTISLTAAGGSGTYRFSWSDGSIAADRVDLPPGEYDVTATDANGCTDSLTAIVSGAGGSASVTFTAEINGGCADDSTGYIRLLPDTNLRDPTYHWNTGDTTRDLSGLAPGTYTLTVTEAGGCSSTFSYEVPVPTAWVVTVDSTVAAGCGPVAGGKIFSTVTGGTAPYSYDWSDGITTPGGTRDGLAAGSYSATVTDAEGCTTVLTAEVAPAAEIFVTVTSRDASCGGVADGSISVEAAGGNGSLRVVWEGFPDGSNLTGLPAGIYPFSVRDAGGCVVRDTARILEPEPVFILADTAYIGCGDGQLGEIAVSVSGGSGSYSYRWSDGGAATPRRQNLVAGTYTVTVTDATGCTASATYPLSPAGDLFLTPVAQAPVCPGEATGSLKVIPTGGTGPFLYSLDGSSFVSSPAFENLEGGTYLVFVRDAGGCILTQEVDVPIPSPFTVDLGPDQTLPFGDSIILSTTVTGARGELDYQWGSTDPESLSCSDCPDPVATPIYETDYFLLVYDTLGCSAADDIRIFVPKIREVAVPTGFTPNGDGHNDRLLVHGHPGTRVRAFNVFDRWGGLLFETGDFEVNDETAGWDGNDSRGRALNGGVYLYKLLVEYPDGSQETRSGQTTLIR